MLDFVESGAKDVPAIATAITTVGEAQFRIVAIKLLSWLKSQNRMQKLSSLSFKPEYEWSNSLRRLFVTHGFLNDLIHIDESSVTLNPQMDVDERKNLLAFVDSKFQPPLMADPVRRPKHE